MVVAVSPEEAECKAFLFTVELALIFSLDRFHFITNCALLFKALRGPESTLH